MIKQKEYQDFIQWFQKFQEKNGSEEVITKILINTNIITEYKEIKNSEDNKDKETIKEFNKYIIEKYILNEQFCKLEMNQKEIQKEDLEQQIERIFEILYIKIIIKSYLKIINQENYYNIYIVLENGEEYPDLILIKKEIQKQEWTLKELQKRIIRKTGEEEIKLIKIYKHEEQGGYISYNKLEKPLFTEVFVTRMNREYLKDGEKPSLSTEIVKLNWYNLIKYYELKKGYIKENINNKQQKERIQEKIMHNAAREFYNIYYSDEEEKNKFKTYYNYSAAIDDDGPSVNKKTLQLVKDIDKKRNTINIFQEIEKDYYEIKMGLKALQIDCELKLQTFMKHFEDFPVDYDYNIIKNYIQNHYKVKEIVKNIKKEELSLEKFVDLIYIESILKEYYQRKIKINGYKEELITIEYRRNQKNHREEIIIKRSRYLTEQEIIKIIKENQQVKEKILIITEKEAIIIEKVEIKKMKAGEQEIIINKKRYLEKWYKTLINNMNVEQEQETEKEQQDQIMEEIIKIFKQEKGNEKENKLLLIKLE